MLGSSISDHEMKPFFCAVLISLPLTLGAQESRPLSIEEAVRLAIERNERSAIAETSVAVAEARVNRARSVFLPQLGINSTLRNDSAADTRNTLSATANLSQPLFDARAFPLMRFARLDLESARANAGEARRVLGYDAANSFVSALSFQQVMVAAEHRREFAEATLADARARFDAGLVSSNDVTKAQLELSTAERGVAQASGNVQAARVSLANVVAVEIAGLLQEPVQLLAAASTASPASPDAIRLAQERRGDIVGRRARVGALRAFSEEPATRFIPSLMLSAQSRNVNERTFTNRETDGFVGVSMNWSVFDAGLRRADRLERTAQARAAELELGLSLREVDAQMRSAAAQLVAEQTAARLAATALVTARRNADETNELYRQGLATALDVAFANQQLFDAEVAEVTARYRMALAYLAMREASGEGAVE